LIRAFVAKNRQLHATFAKELKEWEKKFFATSAPLRETILTEDGHFFSSHLFRSSCRFIFTGRREEREEIQSKL
jgi:hypothetical protein